MIGIIVNLILLGIGAYYIYIEYEKNEELKSTTYKLRMDIQLMTTDYEKLERNSKILVNENQKLEENNKILFDENQKLHSDNELLTDCNKILVNENKELSDKNIVLDNTCDRIIIEHTKLESNYHTLYQNYLKSTCPEENVLEQ